MTEQEYFRLRDLIRELPPTDTYSDPETGWWENYTELGGFRRTQNPDGDFIRVAWIEETRLSTYTTIYDEGVGNSKDAVWEYLSERPLIDFLRWKSEEGGWIPFREIFCENKLRPYMLFRHFIYRFGYAWRAFCKEFSW